MVASAELVENGLESVLISMPSLVSLLALLLRYACEFVFPSS